MLVKSFVAIIILLSNGGSALNIFNALKSISQPRRKSLSKDFLSIVENSQRGLISTKNEQIFNFVNGLVENPEIYSSNIGGTWKLLWTTEKVDHIYNS